MLQTRINAGFTKYFCLFKLNYNYCNTRNTRKSLQKTKVLLPDVLFRQAIAPLSYFILFSQIGISHHMGALDNLVKGAAGQAVQNMNIMFGFDEAEGLRMAPVFP